MKLPELDTVKEYLDTLPIIVAYVFGSRATGEAKEDSDLDIAIVPEKGVEFDYQQQAEIQDKLQNLIPDIKVQLTVLRPKASSILAVKVFRGMPILVRDQFAKNLFEVNSYKRYRRQKHYMDIYSKYMIDRILEEQNAH